jgi:hypothetical protein
MHQFSAQTEIIGVNPFVFVPEDIFQRIFEQAGKNKGTIPIVLTWSIWTKLKSRLY